MRALLGFVGLGFGASPFGLRLLHSNLAFGIRLPLLGAPFITEVILPRDDAGGLLDLALHAFDHSLDAGLWTAVLVFTHRVSFSFFAFPYPSLGARNRNDPHCPQLHDERPARQGISGCSSMPTGLLIGAVFGRSGAVDADFSIGLLARPDGTISDVLFNSPAFKAGLGPSEKIIAVNGRAFSGPVMALALKAAKGTTQPIDLIVENTGWFRTVHLDYHDGEKFPVLKRVDNTPDTLSEILKPLAK